ncbi:MAG TPA: hypothetical protein VF768_01245 [Holophagaceae bacterium]
MSNEIPPSLQAYLPGVSHTCTQCGHLIVDAVETPGEPFRCLECRSLVAPPEDELTRQALEDRSPVDIPDARPTFWRVVVVLLFAIVALGIVFWMR